MYGVGNGCTVGLFRLNFRKRLILSMRYISVIGLLPGKQLQVYACVVGVRVFDVRCLLWDVMCHMFNVVCLCFM